MSTRTDAALVATAIFATGLMAGTVLISTVGPEPTTLTVTAPPVTQRVTLPPKVITRTVEVTRAAERASRSSQRVSTPERMAQMPATGTRALYMAHARTLVPADQWPCLKALWTRESNWNPRSVGALVDGVHVVGIPQLRGLKVTDGWRYQIKRGLTYIDHRYGTPCAAWATFGRQGWY
jgi:hypothetical protein